MQIYNTLYWFYHYFYKQEELQVAPMCQNLFLPHLNCSSSKPSECHECLLSDGKFFLWWRSYRISNLDQSSHFSIDWSRCQMCLMWIDLRLNLYRPVGDWKHTGIMKFKSASPWALSHYWLLNEWQKAKRIHTVSKIGVPSLTCSIWNGAEKFWSIDPQ